MQSGQSEDNAGVIIFRIVENDLTSPSLDWLELLWLLLASDACIPKRTCIFKYSSDNSLIELFIFSDQVKVKVFWEQWLIALIFQFLGCQWWHQPKLQDHGLGASVTHGVPVYCPQLQNFAACWAEAMCVNDLRKVAFDRTWSQAWTYWRYNNYNLKVVKTMKQHVSRMNLSGYVGNVTYYIWLSVKYCVLFSSRVTNMPLSQSRITEKNVYFMCN